MEPLATLVAQVNLVVGDLEGNFQRVKQIYESEKRSNCHHLVAFPELTLTGYPPNDLLLRKGFVDEQLALVEEVRKLTLESPVVLLIGAVTRNTEANGKPLHNSAIAFQNGREIFRYNKQLLPTYNIFDEARYFQPGKWNQNNSLEFTDGKGRKHVVGVLVCEDCWNDEAITDAPLYTSNPVKNSFTGLALDAVVTINASPSDIGKHVRRYAMYKTLSEKYRVPFIYVNSVGAQDSLIFDGHSFVYTDGHFYYAKGFREHIWSVSVGDNNNHHEPKHPPVTDETKLTIDHLVLGIRDYVLKNGFSKVVVGSSGGIDSAVVLALATEALGAENVFAVTMPTKFSSTGSVTDSEALCKALGIKLYTHEIQSDMVVALENFEAAFGEKPKRITIENLQARIRGRILMEFSNQTGALVLSTGNKSEMSVGYCTIYGDMCGGLSVIADLYKMEVYAVAQYFNDIYAKEIIPQAIIDKAPSAELWEGQKDSDSLPPYPVLDAILKLYLERDLLTREEIKACETLVENLTLKEIKRVLKMTDGAEFKRRQAAPVLRVHRRAFGFGRNLPITQKHKISLENVL